MSEDIYEVISLGMRYWFVLLGGLIVLRAFLWLRKDRREKHRRLRQLPDAGMIGELVVIVGSDELPEGTAIAVPREGTLGFLRTCDVVVPVPGVAPHHVDFTFRDGKGLLLSPWRGQTVQVDGNELTHRTRASQHPMHHGSRLFVGDAVLRLRVFAGLEVSRHVTYAEDEPQQQEPQPELAPAAWQDTPYVYHQHAPAWQDSGRYDPQAWLQQPPQQQWTQPYVPTADEVWQEDDYVSPQQADALRSQRAEDAFPTQPMTPFSAEIPAAEDDFAPARPRQRRSRRERRESHEEA